MVTKSYVKTEAAYAALQSHKPVVVYDTETTGLSPKKERVIQFAAKLYVWNDTKLKYEEAETCNLYINPDTYVSAEIENLTGITKECLADKPSEAEVFPKIVEFLCKGRIFVGYNKKFDDKFIDAMAERCVGKHFVPQVSVDPLTLARELIPWGSLPENKYKLCNVAEYYMVTQEGFHNAFVDVENTWRVLLAEMDDYEVQKEESQSTAPVKNLEVYSVREWKKSFSASNRIDRLYISSNYGLITYDRNKNEIMNDNVIDPKELAKILQDQYSITI